LDHQVPEETGQHHDEEHVQQDVGHQRRPGDVGMGRRVQDRRQHQIRTSSLLGAEDRSAGWVTPCRRTQYRSRGTAMRLVTTAIITMIAYTGSVRTPIDRPMAAMTSSIAPRALSPDPTAAACHVGGPPSLAPSPP